jgi:hypothetical protein
MKEDPPPDARCRDKFLVQSVAISSAAEVGNVSQIWQNIEQTSKSSIQEKKIRVNFLPADGASGAASAAAATNGLEPRQQHEDSPPAYSSPTSAAATPARSVAQGPVSTLGDKPADAKSRGDAVDSAHNPATSQSQSTPGAAAASVASVIPTSQADLQRQLDAANAQIKKLQEQATEGLRQRKITADGQEKSSVSTSLQNAPAPGGVPVQIVAGLCLLCFLIAYLFF